MNKVEKEIAKASLKAEDKTLKELQQIYKKARLDVQQKIADLNARTDMQNLQSIIYQKKYQQAILGQINEALADLKSGQYKTIEQYLTESYEYGYTGMMYSLQSQGIPIIMPIDERKVVQAMTTDSKLSSNYYKANPLKGRLEEDVDKLKDSIRTTLSRGIVSGKSWLDVAVELASVMNNPFDKAMHDAMRIVRTEGHRVNQQGFLDAGDEAKKKGANILKQWDATMDGVTRPWHMEADGQIVEWDEDFIVMGEKLKAPSIGGSARNVCNCRCQLLQRARWALDEDELKTLQERAEFFGLDKSESFEDYKQKYLKLPEKADTIELEVPDLFGFHKTKGQHTLMEDLAKVNPNYTTGRLYQNNCGYCSASYELLRRGYDVEANPLDGMYLYEWKKMFKGFYPHGVTAKRKTTALVEMKEEIASWGEGARGGVFVIWDGRNWGHYFNVEVVNGEVVFVDGQNNKYGQYVEDYFKRVKPSSIEYGRWDHLDLSEFGKKAVKNRGE